MSDFLELFGITIEDIEKKQEKKKEESTKKESKSKEARKKAVTSKTYALPIKVCAGHLTALITDEKETEMGEESLKNKMRQRYVELSGCDLSFATLPLPEEEPVAKTYIKMFVAYKVMKEEQKLEFPLSIRVGDEKMEFEAESTLSDIRNQWEEVHREYRGCQYHYDDKQHILLPFMLPDVAEGMLYQCPITVGYLTITEIYQEKDFEKQEVNLSDIQKLYESKYPEFSGCAFYFNQELNQLIPIIDFEKSKEPCKKIALPVLLRAGGFNLEMNTEDFKGQETATLEEIRNVLEGIYPEYSKERTEMLYDQRHFIIPVLKSSRKGVRFIPVRDRQCQYSFVGRDKKTYRIEQMPYGEFAICTQEENPEVEFHFSGPLIPSSILDSIIIFFRGEPDREAALQLFYDCEKESFELFQPKQTATAGSVEFIRSPERENAMILMMDIHSHGHFSAFFSSIDNHDEKGIRLFLVIGNLDKPIMTQAFRAGMLGYYKTLRLADVFAIEGGYHGLYL